MIQTWTNALVHHHWGAGRGVGGCPTDTIVESNLAKIVVVVVIVQFTRPWEGEGWRWRAIIMNRWTIFNIHWTRYIQELSTNIQKHPRTFYKHPKTSKNFLQTSVSESSIGFKNGSLFMYRYAWGGAWTFLAPREALPSKYKTF
jgi:hypothetical protein